MSQHYVLGIWYKPSELGKRSALLTASQNSGALFAGVMQGAIFTTLNGKNGMSGWRVSLDIIRFDFRSSDADLPVVDPYQYLHE